jgi:hypothetical protein
MLRELRWKPDFGKTLDRFEAWWRREIIDRSPVTVSVKELRKHVPIPEKQFATARERWLDVEYNVRRSIAWLEGRHYVGDSFPALFPNVGPEVNATVMGCELEFGETTSWSKPIIHDPAEWPAIVNRPMNFDNPYWRAIEQITDLALEMCEGRYVVTLTDIHDNYDLLAALRDPQHLCIDLMDCPEVIERCGRATVRVFQEMFNRNWAKVKAAGHPCTNWTPALSVDAFYEPSCDFWCMVSDQVAKELILPDIVAEMQVLDRSLFHLDGINALRHLDLLLDLPQLTGVQWVYGSGNGPAVRWMDTYRRIKQAGKVIQLLAETPRDALDVLAEIGQRGVWVCVAEPFDTVESADAFIRDVAKVKP